MMATNPKQKIYQFLCENRGLYFKVIDIVQHCDVVRGSAYYALNSLAAEGLIRRDVVVRTRWGIPNENANG